MDHIDGAFRYVAVFADGDWGDLLSIDRWPQPEDGLIRLLANLRVINGVVGPLRAADAEKCGICSAGNKLEARYVAFMENK